MDVPAPYCFVEELTVHCLQRLLPTGITVTEIPFARSVVEAPTRTPSR
jgi:hypothetical protein